MKKSYIDRIHKNFIIVKQREIEFAISGVPNTKSLLY